MNRTERAIHALLADNDDANDLDLQRALLIAPDIADDPDTPASLRPLAHALNALHAMLDAESMTTLLLSLSLCPLHRCDYAICFDDDDADCAAIRRIHPSHDS